MSRRDFLWAMSELGRGERVRRVWWPRSQCVARDAHGTTVLLFGEASTSFAASRGDVNANDWVRA